MHTAQPIVYDELQAALSLAGVELSASEVHGVICGSVCNQLKTGAGPDLQRLLSVDEAAPAEVLASLRDLLAGVLQQIVEDLYRNQSEFQLLLADDDENLDVRLQSLGDWCQGFLIGLLNHQPFAIDQLSTDTAEVARDIVAVSEIDATQNDEANEWDFAEVEEYVRVGVQLIFEELCQIEEQGISGEMH